MKAFAWLLKAGLATAGLAMAMPVSADVESGIDAWLRGDYAEAISQWRPLAIEGDPDAQFNLGQAYKLGRGVPADLVQAEQWYQRAAVQGHQEAEDNYGLALFQNGRRAEALPWLEKSVARGEPRAEYILGTALFNGDVAVKDRIRAYALVARASAAGLSQASRALAQMDEYMPLAERQEALAMARKLQTAHIKAVAPATAKQPVASPPAAAKPVGAPYPVPGTPASAVEVAAKPAEAPAPKPVPKAEPAKSAPVQVARTEPATPAPAARASGDWRIQLGAFSEAARARTLWGTLKPRVKGLAALEPFYIKAGAMTRLQAGPVAKADADRLCIAIKAAGQPCLAVKP